MWGMALMPFSGLKKWHHLNHSTILLTEKYLRSSLLRSHNFSEESQSTSNYLRSCGGVNGLDHFIQLVQ